jgi:hypothetical protein
MMIWTFPPMMSGAEAATVFQVPRSVVLTPMLALKLVVVSVGPLGEAGERAELGMRYIGIVAVLSVEEERGGCGAG